MITYNNEFKAMVVELYKTGRKVKEISREYGVSEVTIYKWMKQEILRLREENEILKRL